MCIRDRNKYLFEYRYFKCCSEWLVRLLVKLVEIKNVFLTIETNLEILKWLSKGESEASLSKIYNVGTSTINDIKAQKDKLEKYAEKLDSEERSQNREWEDEQKL